MENITKLDEDFSVEERLKWAKEFLGLKPEQSFQELDAELDEENNNDRKYELFGGALSYANWIQH